jgi:hypothetical protein
MNRLVNYDSEEGNTFLCLDCGKEEFYETDLLVCDECIKKYDAEKIWELHDNNQIDALDFNESEVFRKQFIKGGEK